MHSSVPSTSNKTLGYAKVKGATTMSIMHAFGSRCGYMNAYWVITKETVSGLAEG